MKKQRLDELVVEQGLATNIEEARRFIMAGEIRTGDRVWDKAGEKISIDTELELKSRHCKWVSKGGLKLEKAIKDFSLNPSGARCLDIGASTGGFTDVLLQNGAKEVVALDVGQGLLDPKIANDPRVIIKDKTNFKLLQPGDLGEPFDVVVDFPSAFNGFQDCCKVVVLHNHVGCFLCNVCSVTHGNTD